MHDVLVKNAIIDMVDIDGDGFISRYVARRYPHTHALPTGARACDGSSLFLL